MESKYVMASFLEIKDEVFVVINEVQFQLNEFFINRKNSIALQIAIEKMEQLVGILALIQNMPGHLLAKEIQNNLVNIPTGAGEEKDALLSAMVGAIYTLHRYLESFGTNPNFLPELVIPIINQLRIASKSPEIHESIFFKVDISPRPKTNLPELEPVKYGKLVRQMRHMFNLGLLEVIRDNNYMAGIKLMKRSIAALDKLLSSLPGSNLLWIAAALLEVYQDGALVLNRSRKQIFMQINKEITKMLANKHHVSPVVLLEDMLYLIALGRTDGPLVQNLRKSIALPDLKVTDKELQHEYRRLTGPSLDAVKACSVALRDELNEVQDTIDLIWRDMSGEDVFSKLIEQITKIIKVLDLVGMQSSSALLKQVLPIIIIWSKGAEHKTVDLDNIADAIITVESHVHSLGKGELDLNSSATEHDLSLSLKNTYNEAQILILDEVTLLLNDIHERMEECLAEHYNRNILADISGIVASLVGAFLFLGKVDAAKTCIKISKLVEHFVGKGESHIPEEILKPLIDIFSALEYYVERLCLLDIVNLQNILDSADSGLQQLTELAKKSM